MEMSNSEVLLEDDFVVGVDDEKELKANVHDNNVMFLLNNAGESKANMTRSDEGKDEQNI